MDPLPSKNLYAVFGEYLTVSLNVEHRENSSCTIKKICHVECNQQSNLVKFQRVGACGFRVRADESSSWLISQQTRHYLRHGSFDISIRKTTIPVKLSFYDNTSAVIPLDSFDKSFCKIKRPNTKKKYYGLEYFIENIDKSNEGKWEVEYYNNLNGDEDAEELIHTKIYQVTVEDKPEVFVDIFINNNRTMAKIGCKIQFESLKQCTFEGPHGTVVNEQVTAENSRYNIEVLNKIETSDDLSKCELTIYNLTTRDSGSWKCSLRDDIHTVNQTLFMNDQSMTSINYMFKTIYQEFNINCTENNEWQSCSLQHPDGKIDIYNKKNKSILNTCGIKINEAKLKHTGNWTCKILNSDGVTETKKIFSVKITKDKVVPIIKHEIVDKKKETILEAMPFSDDGDERIEKCIWEHPNGDDLRDHDKYIIHSNNETCSLRIKDTKENDKGTWICRIELSTLKNTTLIRTAYFDLHEVESTWRFIVTIGQWTVTIFYLVLLVGSLLWYILHVNTVSTNKNDECKSTKRLLEKPSIEVRAINSNINSV
ncbi:uncharacterized protein LOC122848906 [Aphidius gifuensis]|nr:uncharacterized protein LOC122848906 [Aphidius gifuensis]